MNDAVGSLGAESQALYGKGSLDASLYADDTLLVGVPEACVQKLLNAVAAATACCGQIPGVVLRYSTARRVLPGMYGHTYNSCLIL